MVLRLEIRAVLSLALTVVSGLVIHLNLSSYAYAASQPKRILILPFYVAAGNNEKELRDFGDHSYKRLRSVIDLLKEEYVSESQKATDKILEGKPAPGSDEEARLMAAKTGADLVIYGSLSVDDSMFHMRGVMWDLATAREIALTDVKVGNIHGLPGVLQLFIGTINKRLHGAPLLPLYRAEPSLGAGGDQPERAQTLVALPRNIGPWRSPEIPAEYWAVGIGDLDGDRRNEIVFLEETGITIRRFESGGLKTLTQFSQAPVRYISAEVADLDGEGIAKLVVCYQTPEGIESAIMQYKNRKLEVTQKFPNIILGTVTELPGEKKALLGQRTDTEDIFNGEMLRYDMRDGKAVLSGQVALPPGTLLLSYAAGEFGKDKKNKEFLRIVLNQDQRLLVFDRENRLMAQVSDRIYGLERRIHIPTKDGYKEVIFPGRILIADTGGAGENELLLVKHGSAGSSVQALVWEGGHLVDKWKTVMSPGIITDFRIGDLKNEQTRSLVLILLEPNPFFAFTGPHSIVFAYDLTP